MTDDSDEMLEVCELCHDMNNGQPDRPARLTVRRACRTMKPDCGRKSR